MNSFTVLRDVGNSLKKLFKANVTELSDENSVIFDSPGEIESSPVSKLSVFLYKIVPNNQLRNEPPEAMSLNQMKYPPVIADLHYILTPYAQNRETELIILERIIQILNDNAVFRGDMLEGNLKESGNEKIRIIPESLSLDDLNKLWGIFPNKTFKLSVSYLLTPVKVPSSRTPKVITRVTEYTVGM